MYLSMYINLCGFRDSSVGKQSFCSVETPWDSWVGKIRCKGKGYPLQCSGLENPMDCIAHGVTKSWTRLSHGTCLFMTAGLPW